MLQLDPGSSVDYDPDTGAQMVVGKVSLKFASALRADFVDLSCSFLDLELEAILSSAAASRPLSTTIDSEQGSSPCTSTVCPGAGHGGQGGMSSGGSHYGSVYRPLLPGSKSNPSGGHGGGKMHLRVGSTLINDGEISVNGSSSTHGGGSGGSILIETYFIDGYGVISSMGGGGKGRRLLLLCKKLLQLQCKFFKNWCSVIICIGSI